MTIGLAINTFILYFEGLHTVILSIINDYSVYM